MCVEATNNLSSGYSALAYRFSCGVSLQSARENLKSTTKIDYQRRSCRPPHPLSAEVKDMTTITEVESYTLSQ
jgi:hypothetical protein